MLSDTIQNDADGIILKIKKNFFLCVGGGMADGPDFRTYIVRYICKYIQEINELKRVLEENGIRLCGFCQTQWGDCWTCDICEKVSCEKGQCPTIYTYHIGTHPTLICRVCLPKVCDMCCGVSDIPRCSVCSGTICSRCRNIRGNCCEKHEYKRVLYPYTRQASLLYIASPARQPNAS